MVAAMAACQLQAAARADAGERVHGAARSWDGGGRRVGMLTGVSRSPWLLLVVVVLLPLFPDQAWGSRNPQRPTLVVLCPPEALPRWFGVVIVCIAARCDLA